MVRAGLHRHEERRAARTFAGRLECDHLGVRFALPFVPAFADDLAVTNDDGADDGIRVRRPAPALRELERTLEAHASSCTSRR